MDIPDRWTFKSNYIASNFDSHVQEQLPWYKQALDLTYSIASQYLYKGASLYDFGAATGNLSTLFNNQDMGYEVIPVDDSQPMCEIMKERGLDPICADMNALQLKPFDVAICFLSLMFLPPVQQVNFIEKLRAHRKLGGIILILDKFTPTDTYLQKVYSRITISNKLATTDPRDIVKKELSLAGIQRPLSTSMLGEANVYFCMGEFAGYAL